MKNESPEDHVLKIDWKEMDEKERTELILRHAVYIELHRKFVHVRAVYGSDIRSLLSSFVLVVALLTFRVDPRYIALSLLGMQILFAAISRLSTYFVEAELETMRVNYIDYLKSRKRNE